MADEIDRAQANDEFFRELALRSRCPSPLSASVKVGSTGTDTDNGQRACVDCGEPIPEARLKAAKGATRCVACQTVFEQIHTHWRAL